ncbi:MAG: hypothetical protein K2X99_00255, partial [Gemmatimonadaceae bacterium]|nr:hypothetical protein [Gemmatimonadaceae bacterium]
VATFNGLTITSTTTGPVVLTFTSGSLTATATVNVTVPPPTPVASALAATAPATATSGVALAPVATATVKDQFNATMTGATGSVVVSTNTLGATLSGNVTVTVVNGVATFSGLTITRATPGPVVLTFTYGSLVATATVNVTVPSVASALVATASATATSGLALAPASTATINDQFGATFTSFTGAVTVSTTTAGATLSGGMSANAVAGVATFNGLTISTPNTSPTPVQVTLTFTSGALTGSAVVTVSPQLTATSMVASAPATATSGVAFGATATIRDQFAAAMATFNGPVTVSTTTAGVTLGGTTTINAAAGVANFAGLTLSAATSRPVTLTFTSGALSATASVNLTVPPAPAALTPSAPASVNHSELFTVSATVIDQYGNVLTNHTQPVTVTTNTPNAQVYGTATLTAVNGVATFSGISLTVPVSGPVVLTFTTGSLVTTATVNVIVAPPTGTVTQIQLSAPSTVPSTVTLGPPPQVYALDAAGEPVFEATGNVQVTTTTPGVTLVGQTSEPLVGAVATFQNFAIRAPGGNPNVTLIFTYNGLTISHQINVTVEPAVWLRMPSAVQNGVEVGINGVGVNVPTEIIIRTATDDALGARNTFTYPGETVNVEWRPEGGGTSLYSNVTFVGAVALPVRVTFPTLQRYLPYLTASGGRSTPPWDLVTVIAGNANVPPGAVRVEVSLPGQAQSGAIVAPPVQVFPVDQSGNYVGGMLGSATLTTSTPGVTLSGNTATFSGGVASFPNLVITHASGATVNVTLSASADILTGTGTINVTASGPPPVATSVQLVAPTSAQNGIAMSNLVATVRDQNGAVMTSASGNVTLSVPTGVTISGTATVALSGGVATFSGISLTSATLPQSVTVTATFGALSGTANISLSTPAAPVPTSLVAAGVPASVNSGEAFGFTVGVFDQFGDAMPSASGSVTIAAPGIAGTLTAPLNGGVATFSGITLTGATGSVTIALTSGSLTGSATTSLVGAPPAATPYVYVTSVIQSGNPVPANQVRENVPATFTFRIASDAGVPQSLLNGQSVTVEFRPFGGTPGSSIFVPTTVAGALTGAVTVTLPAVGTGRYIPYISNGTITVDPWDVITSIP